jgi:hypothetical protein
MSCFVSSRKRECLIVVRLKSQTLSGFFLADLESFFLSTIRWPYKDLMSRGGHALETLAYPDRLFESEHYAGIFEEGTSEEQRSSIHPTNARESDK